MRDIAGRSYRLIFGTAYLILMTSALVLVVTLPFLAVLMTTDPRASWPWLVLTAPMLAPAVQAAFGVFSAHAADGSPDVIRVFARTWWRGLARTITVGAAGSIVVTALIADVILIWGHRAGALLIPVLVSAVLLVVITLPVILAALAEDPGLPLGPLARASVWLAVRRWYLGLLSVAALVVLAQIVIERPAWGLGVVLAPALYLLWGNARAALRPVLSPTTSRTR